MTLHCKLVERLAEGDAFWNEWQALMAETRPGLGIYGPHWYNIWRETLGSRGRWTGRTLIISVRDENDTLVGLMPLGEQKIGPVSVFSIGGEWQPARAIVATAEHEHAVGHAIGTFVAQTRWLVLRMAPCVLAAPGIQGFLDALDARRVYRRVQRSEPVAIYNAEGTWDSYRADVLGKKFDKRILYYERRLRKQGEVEIVHFRKPTAEDIERMVPDMGSIEERSWLGKSGEGYLRFSPPLSAEMWKRLLNKAISPADQVDAWVLYLDGTPMSFCFTLTDRHVRYILANNYDESMHIHSTGSILYRRMVENGFERGVTFFNFGGSEIHYKSRWGASYQDESQSLLFIPNTLVGSAAKPVTRFHEWAVPQLETVARHPRIAPLARHPRVAPIARNLGIRLPEQPENQEQPGSESP